MAMTPMMKCPTMTDAMARGMTALSEFVTTVANLEYDADESVRDPGRSRGRTLS